MYNGLILIRSALIIGGLFVMAGCSATHYSPPIATFAKATANAHAALADLNKIVTAEYTDFLAQRALTDLKQAVKGKDEECGLGSVRCRIVLVSPTAPDNATLFPPEPLLANMVVVMGDVNAYAQNLATLVAEDSAEKAAADVNAALGSVEKLANTVAKAGGKDTTKEPVPSFATPVGAAVNWLIGQYANYVKLEGLKLATKEAKPVIERAAEIFKLAAVFGSDPQRAEFVNLFRKAIDEYQDERKSETKLNAAVIAARQYDDFLQSQPSATFEQMGKAHSALADALQNPNPSWPQVIAQVLEFAAQAEELAKISQGLAELGAKKKGAKK